MKLPRVLEASEVSFLKSSAFVPSSFEMKSDPGMFVIDQLFHVEFVQWLSML